MSKHEREPERTPFVPSGWGDGANATSPGGACRQRHGSGSRLSAAVDVAILLAVFLVLYVI